MPFHRCTACNGILEPIDKESISDRLLPNTWQYYDEFRICPSCGKIYWKGSHYQRMKRLIEHGRPASTPAAVVSAGTTDHEQVVTAPLGAIARAAEDLPTPALVVVGEVVALRASLRAVRRSAA